MEKVEELTKFLYHERSVVAVHLILELMRHVGSSNRLIEADRSTCIAHIRRGIALQERVDRIRYNDPLLAASIITEDALQYLAVIRSAAGRFASIHFEMGDCFVGIVEDVDEDLRSKAGHIFKHL